MNRWTEHGEPAMNWRDLVSIAYRATPDGASRFEPGANATTLDQTEKVMKYALPPDLRDMLAESDGVTDILNLDGVAIETGWLLWPSSKIRERTSRSRSEIDPPATWVVFADAGVDGIEFGYDTSDPSNRIWAWEPIESGAQPIAGSLSEFIQGRISGKIV